MWKFFEKTKGAISILLTLIMLPMFTLAGLFVDGSRISAARIAVSGAGDLAMNSALSEYNQVLKNAYGILAMSENMEELEKNIELYFTNTLNNAGILAESDSYTRNFINSIGSMFSNDEISFENIVDTQAGEFSLVAIPGSAVGNPLVLERQIVEFMKYRGPIGIGKGILTKLGFMGETSKQTKALEKKVEYDKGLNKIQEACQVAYEAIIKFNEIVNEKVNDDGNFKGEENYIATDVNKDIEEAKKKLEEMTQYAIAANSLKGEIGEIKEVESIRTSFGTESANLTPIAAYNLAVSKYDAWETAYEAQLSDSAYNNFSLYFPVFEDSELQEEIAYRKFVSENIAQFSEGVTYVSLIEENYNRLLDAEKEANKKAYEDYTSIKQGMYLWVEYAKELPGIWAGKAKELDKEASNKINAWYDKAFAMVKELNTAVNALNRITTLVKELDATRVDWKNSVDDLSDGEVKTSMTNDYKSSAKDLNEAAINELLQILNDNKTHFEEFISGLSTMSYCGVKLVVESRIVGSDLLFGTGGEIVKGDYISRENKIPQYEVTDYKGIKSSAATCMNENYKPASFANMTKPEFKKITEDIQFYKYLTTICKKPTTSGGSGGTGSGSNEGESKDNDRKTLTDNANNNGINNVTVPDANKGNISSVLSGDISVALAELSGNMAKATPGSYNPSSYDRDAEYDDTADKNDSDLSGITNLISNLGNILKEGRDLVYVEEYMTEMFSCYTSCYDAQGNALTNVESAYGKDANDITKKYDLTKNKFYRSEVEYILWGQDSVEANLRNTKGMIFGVRFALNSVYAFTSAHIQKQAGAAATAIAGWTGFGVPIVQTVITLLWSLAESVCDVDDICNEGKAVVLYKSPQTWVTSIAGVRRKAAEIIQEVGEAAIDKVGDIFEKIDGLTDETISDVEGYLNNYIDSTTSGVVDSALGTIINPIRNKLNGIISNSYNWSKDEVGKKIDECLAEIEASINAENDGVAKSAKLAGLNLVKTTYRDTLVDTAYSCYEKMKASGVDAATEINNAVDSLISTIENAITEPIKAKVSEAGKWLNDEFDKITDEMSDTAQEKLTEALEDYTKQISGVDLGSEDSVADVSTAGGVTLNYKEYIKIFCLMFMLSEDNKTSMLRRTAELIQINVQQHDTDFDITKAYTMLEVQGDVSIKTTFFSVPVTTQSDAGVSYSLDFSKIGSGRQTVKYVGVSGY